MSYPLPSLWSFANPHVQRLGMAKQELEAASA